MLNTRLNVGQQWALTAKTANCILGYIRECIEGEEGGPFSCAGCPHLECCVECWTAQYVRDMDTLERVQSKNEEGMNFSSEEEKV